MNLQETFSLKTFVGPTPTRQSHTVPEPTRHGCNSSSVTAVLRDSVAALNDLLRVSVDYLRLQGLINHHH